MENKKTFKIYKVKTYKISQSVCEESKLFSVGDIETISRCLLNDRHYNERLESDQHVKFFLDIEVEGLKIETIVSNLLDYFKNNLNINLEANDIKYTQNDKKFNNIGSYHIVIPKLYSVNSDLKPIAKEITNTYKFKIDTSVYGNMWLRLPNQTGFSTVPKYEHIVKNGELKDFILSYIPDDSSLLNYTPVSPPSSSINQITKVIKKKNETDDITDLNSIINTTIVSPYSGTDLNKLLHILPVTFIDDYENWLKLGALIYSVGGTLEKYIEISKKSKKYESGCCESKWRQFKVKKMTMATLHYWCKLENQTEYNKLQLFKEDVKSLVNPIQINKTYLTTKTSVNTLMIDQDLTPYFEDLFTSKFKSLNIKSPYGTSKTQLIKLVIEKYDPKRVLWLSFRQTLSNDIENNFKELNFKHYKDKKLDADRLIIQLESLLKLQQYEDFDVDDDGECYNITQQYDLIMLDEIESLLRQFDSEKTFKDQSRLIFEYLEQLLLKCKHIISLDGDLGNRAYHFLKQFGEGIYLDNLYKNNTKELYLTGDVNEYDNEIKQLLKDNKKIVIASMSSNKAHYYHDYIKSKYPNLNVIYYTGNSSATQKTTDLKNVNEEWLKYDVIIYSPTIEAGVSFDVPDHIYKIFGIINGGSTSQRSFLQMLARVRNPILSKITILNDGLKSRCKSFFNFDEVKNAMIESRKVKVIYKNGTSKTALDLYDINAVYNKVEELNKNNSLFIPYLMKLAIDKGYKWTESEYTQDKEEKEEQDNERKQFKVSRDNLITKVFHSENISDAQYRELLHLQENNLIQEDQIYQVCRKTLEKQVGLELNEELTQAYFKRESSIKNFSYLIDETNIKDIDDSFIENKKSRVSLVKEVFEILDINCYSNKVFKADDLHKKIKNLNIYSQTNQIIFNKEKTIINTDKLAIAYLNKIFENYNLKLQSEYNGRKEAKNKVYKFIRLHHIDEVIYWQKVRQKIKDSNKMIKRPTKLIYENNFRYYRDNFSKVLRELIQKH